MKCNIHPVSPLASSLQESMKHTGCGELAEQLAKIDISGQIWSFDHRYHIRSRRGSQRLENAPRQTKLSAIAKQG